MQGTDPRRPTADRIGRQLPPAALRMAWTGPDGQLRSRLYAWLGRAALDPLDEESKADGEGLGVIGSAWSLFATPTVFVLDHKGVIRYRQMGIPDKKAIDGVLKELIREAEANAKKEKETGG